MIGLSVGSSSSHARGMSEEETAASKIQAHWRNKKRASEPRPTDPNSSGRSPNRNNMAAKKKRRLREKVSLLQQAHKKWQIITSRNLLPEPSHPSCIHHYQKLTTKVCLDEDSNGQSCIDRFKIAMYLIMEEPSSSLMAEVMSLLVLGTVVLSIICFALETVPELGHVSTNVWFGVEVFCSISFSLEYGIRFWVCTVNGAKRSSFVVGTMNMLDLAAIIPFYVQLIFMWTDSPQSGILRIFRIFRIFRILKLSRYSKGMQMMSEAVMSSMHILTMLFFVLLVGVIIFASMIFFLEKLSCPQLANMTPKDIDLYHAECDDSFNGGKSPSFGLCCDEWESPEGYPSVPAGFWWSIVTMTTVGFGDMYPMTWQGRLVGIFAMLVGILLIALPTAIVGRKFQEVYEREEMLSEMREARENGQRASVMSVVSTIQPTQDLVAKEPDFDAGRKLRSLKLKDPQLRKTMTELASLFEETDQFYAKMRQSGVDQIRGEEQINISFGRVVQFMEDDLYGKRGARSISTSGEKPRTTSAKVQDPVYAVVQDL
eukprot:gnl/MRDRNA2_/MRDRNA2_74521_c0_seq1.p1 gnl/MRDRNA2_/MRDRNA2_74521_c0~~gnl/MRDRNA2_/MRDRNA2_74521_c0_seq1.p1  ORF type:complete len:542 (+),score=76.17 gnl/MRDRNA2_/MRDRNA2_74521_c0_seq1:104-1729(+)